jgi:recombination associated protein RdgC
MFKNLIAYRLKSNVTEVQLIAALFTQQYNPCSSLELNSSGWVPPREYGQLVHKVNGQFLLKLMMEKRVLPGSVVKDALLERCKEIEHQQGYAPGRKQVREIKEQVIDELLPRAFSTKTAMNVWIDPINNWLVIDTPTTSKAELVIKLLLASVDGLVLEGIRTKISPRSAMTNWLATDNEPYNFTIDQDGELESGGSDHAVIKYIKSSLDGNTQVKQQIAEGKQCTKLALTWDSKISFILTEAGNIKKIAMLDVLKESHAETNVGDSGERFDADFALVSGELNQLLTDLIEALGGGFVNEQ